jgi:hypothetical protein
LLEGRDIMTGDHCFGCTAGAGSSCGGALIQEATREGASARSEETSLQQHPVSRTQ